ncbi:MAG: DNA topoisomerase VI [Desulfurococcales archaeon ex4484_58]|nr:MAG: DNA topoisomerase VI [Desulfurococcales archaeon ex4484_58]
MTISSIDKIARDKSISILREKFSEIAKNIIEGKRPVLIMPKRVLSNTIYDERNRLLLLGPEMQKRSFLDVNESRKFMQTLLMASIIYEALVNDEYPTIRDLYYRGKHTISYRDPRGKLYRENTWDEQRESDSVIRDLEVFLGVLREEMLILSKEKGKVVGNLVIKSGDDTIDLSKMGHGAYSIEPTPDLIEFKDVDAEYVLVVEKDAVFQQLHRYGFWKKYKAILITSAGQPDRATRRFVRRLNEELKLPVYILADSDPYGYYIYSVFKIGSITLSYESERLATPNAKFIGVLMTDVFGDKVFEKILNKTKVGDISKKILRKLPRKKPYLSESERKNYIIKAKLKDVERAVELVGYDIADACIEDRELKSKIKRKKEGLAGYPWFRTPEWIRELCIFFNTLSKLEIEAMASKGLKFLADKYIPEKIETKDYID